MKPSRRNFLHAARNTAMFMAASSFAPPPYEAGPLSLAARARRAGLSFGTMVNHSRLRSDAPLMALVVQQADVLVPEVAMKWGMIEQARAKPDYRAAQAIAAFARTHGKQLRGHAAFWYRNIPGWAAPLLREPGGEALALAHASAVVAHFRGRAFEWDVVNEAIDPAGGAPGMLRLQPFGKPVPVGFITDCFQAAHEADPAARLYYNDYGVETEWADGIARRRGILDLLTELRRRGAPIHGFGTQSHLAPHRPFEPRAYRAFLADIAALGLTIRITEFDVADYGLQGSAAMRDARIADYARRYLDCCFDEPAVRGLLTWGLSDPESWILRELPRKDREPSRPLPYDAALRRKPLWTAIAQALDDAPLRPAQSQSVRNEPNRSGYPG